MYQWRNAAKTHTHTPIYIYIYGCVCMSVFHRTMFNQICIYEEVLPKYTHTHTHTHTHIYIYIYIYIYIWKKIYGIKKPQSVNKIQPTEWIEICYQANFCKNQHLILTWKIYFLLYIYIYIYIYMYIYIYIVIHRQTVSVFHNSSVWLDTLDASNKDLNLPNFKLDLVSNPSAISATYISSGMHKY